MTGWFEPGGGTGVVGRRGAAIIAAPPGAPACEVLVGALESDDLDVDAVVGALAELGLRSLPDLAAALVDGDGLRVVVRGAASAAVVASDASSVFDGRRVSTWIEQFTGPGAVTLELEGGRGTSRPYRVEAGVVPARSLTWSSAEGKPDADAAASPPVDVGRAIEPDVPSGPPAEAVADETDLASPPSASIADVVEQEQQPTAGGTPDTPPEAAAPDGADEPAAARAPAVTEVEPADEEFDFAHLLDHTVHQSIAEAAVDPADDEDDGESRTIARARDDVATTPPPDDATLAEDRTLVPVDDAPAPEEPTPAGPVGDRPAPPPLAVIDSVPGSPGSPSGGDEAPPEARRTVAPTPVMEPPVAPPAPELGDHDGHTVARRPGGAGGASPAGPPAEVGPPGGPRVQSVRCPHGHPNPPHVERCVWCGAEVSDRRVEWIGRPPLGVLRLSTGVTVSLDRPLLLGRRPVATGLINDEVPETVAVDDPDQELSRTHVEIRLEDWQVVVVDRESRNHTYVQLPGQELRQLYPHQGVPIVPGTRVDLGRTVSFVYEMEMP